MPSQLRLILVGLNMCITDRHTPLHPAGVGMWPPRGQEDRRLVALVEVEPDAAGVFLAALANNFFTSRGVRFSLAPLAEVSDRQ